MVEATVGLLQQMQAGARPSQRVLPCRLVHRASVRPLAA